MNCNKQFSLTVLDIECDPIGDATWSITVLDPNPGTVFSFTGGDGTYDFNLSGAPAQQGAFYRATSSVLNCDLAYVATCEIDYNISLTNVGPGSVSSITWQVRRNGVLLINETRTAPASSTLNQSGTFMSGNFTMLAGVNYTFVIDVFISAVGLGTTSLASGVLRLRPLTPL